MLLFFSYPRSCLLPNPECHPAERSRPSVRVEDLPAAAAGQAGLQPRHAGDAAPGGGGTERERHADALSGDCGLAGSAAVMTPPQLRQKSSMRKGFINHPCLVYLNLRSLRAAGVSCPLRFHRCCGEQELVSWLCSFSGGYKSICKR